MPAVVRAGLLVASRQARYGPGDLAADPLEPARECPRWSRQAKYSLGSITADPLEPARKCPRWSGQGRS